MQEGQAKLQKDCKNHNIRRGLTKKTQIIGSERRRFELNYKVALGESTSEILKSGDMFRIEDTVCDIYLVSRVNRNLIIGRPVLYIVIDMFSRYIVGFYVGLEEPSGSGRMMALYYTARNKVELCKEYGVEIKKNEWDYSTLPNAINVDRGELGSAETYNLVNNLGITVIAQPPYIVKWKGSVEQCFKKLNSKAIRWQSGALINKHTVRGARDYRKDTLLNLDEFTQIIIHSILNYNNTPMDFYVRDEHMTPEDVSSVPSALWKWGIEKRTGLFKSFPEDMIKANLLPTAKASITSKGLVFKKMQYSCSEDVMAVENEKGSAQEIRKVKVSYDPNDLRCVYLNEGRSYKKYTLGNQKTHL